MGFSPSVMAYFMSRYAYPSRVQIHVSQVFLTSFQSRDFDIPHRAPCAAQYVLLRFQYFILSTCTVALVSNCARLSLFRSIITVLATSFSSFLFFARVRAVYENSRSVTVFFGSFWLAIVGTGLVFLSAAQTSVCQTLCVHLTTMVAFLTMLYIAEYCGHKAMRDN